MEQLFFRQSFLGGHKEKAVTPKRKKQKATIPEPFNVRFRDYLDGPEGISLEEGMRIFLVIVDALSKHSKVSLDLTDIKKASIPFLNASIGNLYSRYHEAFLNMHLCAIVDSEQYMMLSSTIRRARFYYYQFEEQKKNYIGLENLNLEPDTSKKKKRP